LPNDMIFSVLNADPNPDHNPNPYPSTNSTPSLTLSLDFPDALHAKTSIEKFLWPFQHISPAS